MARKTNSPNFLALKEWESRLEDYYLKLTMSRFKWTGLSEIMDQGAAGDRYPEYWLAVSGNCCLTSFPEIADGCIPFPVATTSITFNPFGSPSSWMAYALGAASAIVNGKRLDDTNSAWVWDSNLQKAPMGQMRYLIHEIVRADAASRNNIGTVGHSVIIKTDQEQALSTAITSKQWNDFEPLIVSTSINPTDTTEVLMSDVPFHGLELQEYIQQIDGRIRLMIGLDSQHQSQTHVSERSFMGNDELLCWIRDASLQPRLKAVEQFNKLYGTDVQVEWHQPDESLLNPLMQVSMDGGDGSEEPSNVDKRSE